MLSIYRLPNKLPHEKVIKVVRKDFFILIKRVLMFLALTILPLVIFYLLVNVGAEIDLQGVFTMALAVVLGSIYYLFMWLFFFFTFVDYYLDVWIITNERIIDIEQRGFFSRVISEHKLFRIQDVNSEVNGIFPTLFRFGNVYVQTAGTVPKFHFYQISYPEKVRDMVIKLAQRKRREMIRGEK